MDCRSGCVSLEETVSQGQIGRDGLKGDGLRLSSFSVSGLEPRYT